MEKKPFKPSEASKVDSTVDVHKNSSAIIGNPEKAGKPEGEDGKWACQWNDAWFNPGAAIVVGDYYYICKYNPRNGVGTWERNGRV